MMMRQKAFILSPGDTISGGPEALHQLAGALRAKGVDAAIVYYPTGSDRHTVPEPYRHYNVAVVTGVEDQPTSIVVIPEVATSLAWRFRLARKAIWWLSVDNYFKWRHINPGPSILEPHLDIWHLCQSCYAQDFIAQNQAGPSLMLTDYLTGDVFTPGPAENRVPAIAYNPKKAPATTQRLIAQDPHRVWLPLQHLDKESLAELLRQVRIYVDFGPHPGRDRIPREAALCGAVVITGQKGAAAFSGDVILPERFRINEQAPDFDARVLALIDELLHDDDAFLTASTQQQPYRDWINGNRDAFMAEVDGFIDAMNLYCNNSKSPVMALANRSGG